MSGVRIPPGAPLSFGPRLCPTQRDHRAVAGEVHFGPDTAPNQGTDFFRAQLSMNVYELIYHSSSEERTCHGTVRGDSLPGECGYRNCRGVGFERRWFRRCLRATRRHTEFRTTQGAARIQLPCLLDRRSRQRHPIRTTFRALGCATRRVAERCGYAYSERARIGKIVPRCLMEVIR
jgi:hypothetical protein